MDISDGASENGAALGKISTQEGDDTTVQDPDFLAEKNAVCFDAAFCELHDFRSHVILLFINLAMCHCVRGKDTIIMLSLH